MWVIASFLVANKPVRLVSCWGGVRDVQQFFFKLFYFIYLLICMYELCELVYLSAWCLLHAWMYCWWGVYFSCCNISHVSSSASRMLVGSVFMKQQAIDVQFSCLYYFCYCLLIPLNRLADVSSEYY